ncbi:KICSTOR complex protein ITFG2-like isoform X1 [Tubulanus polymorphus]|uniref:KICSTOR complex protein ITFG2-like isoform X1 n=1 Tax=Tubulanus polymorphus TaxID=672921 RepID=UPI003DA63B30
MRTVSFVKKLEYDFTGNVFNEALVIGDVDNDQSNELVIGNIDGELAVFKGGATWTTGVPTTSAGVPSTAGGVPMTTGVQSTTGGVPATSDGASTSSENTSSTGTGVPLTSAGGTSSSGGVPLTTSAGVPLTASAGVPLTTSAGVPWKYSKHLGMITCISIGDIFNHGKNNIVCLTAEGKCHVFDLNEEQEFDPGPTVNTCNISTNTQQSDKHLNDDSIDDSATYIQPSFTQQLSANSRVMLLQDVDGDGLTELVIGYSDRVVCLFRWIEGLTPDSRIETASASTVTGSIVQLEKWQLAGQVGSITVSHDLDGHIELLVAQPGGSFVKLIRSVEPSDASDASPCDKHLGPSVVYYPLGSALVRSSNVTTVALGGLKTGKIKDGKPVIHCALSTLDGTVILLENEVVEWFMQLEQQFFSLGKLDVMGDGQDEVVTCSWDGQTYIINYNKEVIRFLFDENVAAFCAGNFAVNPGVNVPALVYVTFTGKIYIYYDIAMPTIKPVNLISNMESKTETREILEKLNLQNLSQKELREVYKWCLYGMKSM